MDRLDIIQTPPNRAQSANAGATPSAGATDGEAFLELIEGFLATGTFPVEGEIPAGEATATVPTDGLAPLIAQGLLIPQQLPGSLPGLPAGGELAVEGALDGTLAEGEGETPLAALFPEEDVPAQGTAKAMPTMPTMPTAQGQPTEAGDEPDPAAAAAAATGTVAMAAAKGEGEGEGETVETAEMVARAKAALMGEQAAEGVTNAPPPSAPERHATRDREGGWGQAPAGGERQGGQAGAQGGQPGADDMLGGRAPVEAPTAQAAKVEAGAPQQPGFADTVAALAGRSAEEAKPTFTLVQGAQASASAQDAHETPAAQHLPRTPTPQPHPASEMVGVQLSRMANGRGDQMTIQLRPVELGSVEVKLEIGTDGRVQAMIRAERPETLDLLQRDQKSLEKALQQAGLETDAGSLSFSLKDGGQGERQFAGMHKAFAKLRGDREQEMREAEEFRNLTFVAGAGRAADPGRVDIRI